MNQIAIGIVKKRQVVALCLEWFTHHLNASSAFRSATPGVEVVDGDGQMPEAGILIIGNRLRRGQQFAAGIISIMAPLAARTKVVARASKLMWKPR